MELAIIVTGGTEALLGAALILLVALLILKLSRRSKPDPKLALMLSLMEALPRDAETGNLPEDIREEEVGGKEHGPLGPSGFTFSA